MREDYKKNLKDQKKTIEKMKKNIINLIISIILACIGLFVIRRTFIEDFLAPIMSANLSLFVAILIKASLMVVGVVGIIISLADYVKNSTDLENSVEENEAIVDLINNELEKGKKKTSKTSKEIHKTKDK